MRPQMSQGCSMIGRVAGLINPEDIRLVREAARLDEIVSEHVTLRTAGVGTMKGLCPFHDEKTPSFTVRPQVGFFHCFGCGEGGDVISFVQKIEQLSFVEAVQHLAAKTNITLRFTEGSADYEPNERRRIMEANTAAAAFFEEQLLAPHARPGRDFLRAKGFDRAAAERFGVGFAPAGWDGLVSYLRGKGFTREELIAAGLVSTGKNGERTFDRFRGRVVWPIRDVTGSVIGFGARKLLEEDQGPKYLNTPETKVYKKSHVLYGLDLAKKTIAAESRAAVVEGYTDVMASHLAGVSCAVATCGTAFGEHHAKVLSRMLGTRDVMTGEVVFTFDGDAAGRKAALRTFDLDEQFVARSFVATGPDGLDPNDIRVQRGDDAVRALFEAKQPVYEFVVRSRLERWDLGSIEGRAQALLDVAPVLAAIQHDVARDGYVQKIASMLDLSTQRVTEAYMAAKETKQSREEVAIARAGARQERPGGEALSGVQQASTEAVPVPVEQVDPQIKQAERELLKVLLQFPEVAMSLDFHGLTAEDFRVLPHRQVFETLCECGLGIVDRGGVEWVTSISDVADDALRRGISWLAMDTINVTDEGDALGRYAEGLIVTLRRHALGARKDELMRQLRLEPQSSSGRGLELQQLIVTVDRARHALPQ